MPRRVYTSRTLRTTQTVFDDNNPINGFFPEDVPSPALPLCQLVVQMDVQDLVQERIRALTEAAGIPLVGLEPAGREKLYFRTPDERQAREAGHRLLDAPGCRGLTLTFPKEDAAWTGNDRSSSSSPSP